MSLIQLSRLIDLPDSDLQQVLDYAQTLSKPEAADHFKNLLGDSPQAIEFISSFNSRRKDPKAPAASSSSTASQSQSYASASGIDAVPKPQRSAKQKKQRALHTPAPRQVVNLGPTPGTTYSKKNVEDDYISTRSSSGAASPAPRPGPARQPPVKSATPPPPKPPPSAAGSLISDLLPVPKQQKSKSTPGSRSSTPGPASKAGNVTKISIAGGTPMHGASTAVADLDAAIRALEISTNPTKAGNSTTADIEARRCNCVATRHPLQGAAPNCLGCGKVICLKEGLGPCTFCGTPLLSSGEVQAMIRELRDELGKEKQAANRAANKKAEVSTTPRPFSKPREAFGPRPGEDPSVAISAAEAKAREHRDKLLNFQAQNARRTTVRDEASDFDVSMTASMWASPEDRARELKRQQKLMREMEWNARPDYEKRKQVLSIDVVGGKIVKKMVAAERPPSPEPAEEVSMAQTLSALAETDGNRVSGGGAFIHRIMEATLLLGSIDACNTKHPTGFGLPVFGLRRPATAYSVGLYYAAYDRGLNTWDTANTYSNGVSEEIVGKAIKKYNIPRQKLVILTKCFYPVGQEQDVTPHYMIPQIEVSKDYQNQWGLSRTAIFNQVEDSLRRLDTDYIDLLQIHRFDPKTPIEETMKALHDLVQMGKVRYIGASSMWATQFAQMQFCAERNGWTKFISMQNQYNLLYREEEREMNRFCNETGVGLIPWAPLCRGHLARPPSEFGSTDRSKDEKEQPSVMPGTSETDASIINRVVETAEKRGWKMSQVALAWINAKVTSPIIGFSSVERMVEAIESRGKVLTEEETKYLEELYQARSVVGHD
ncbi:C2HC5 finger protein [Pyricularia oryzae Y34]|uniref:C2HC5 finger protein n=2 Tax=Pyricularia oryzae TaxID=318829 RepID=A0AA97PM97_PYRO3|nr:C2HC5 finger protein [Pyricularia oryzae Y34]